MKRSYPDKQSIDGRKAAATYRIPKSTLSRYVSQNRIPTNAGRFRTVLSNELESLLQLQDGFEQQVPRIYHCRST